MLALLLRRLPKRVHTSIEVDVQAHPSTVTALVFLYRHAACELLLRATALNVVGGARVLGLLQKHRKFRDSFIEIDKQAAQVGRLLPRGCFLTSETNSLSLIGMRTAFSDHYALTALLARSEERGVGKEWLRT